MKDNKLINNILNSLIPKFLSNINDNDKDFMKEKYVEYFNERFGNIDETEINEDAKSIFFDLIVNEELTKWENATLEQKKRLIIKDLNLEKLFCLSNKAFSLALNRLNSNILISEEETSNLEKELNKTYEQIELYNKDIAKTYLSESLLDLEYASGKSTNIISLRIGKEMNQNNKKKNI